MAKEHNSTTEDDVLDSETTSEEQGKSKWQAIADKEQLLEYPSHAELEQRLAELEKEIDEQKKKYLLDMADAQNRVKRIQREAEDHARYILKDFIEKLIPVVDSLEHSLDYSHVTNEQVNSNVKAIREGIELTLKMFYSVLEKFAVEQINPQGQVFDPTVHEAMSMQEAKDVAPQTVVNVLQKGYRLNGRVIRPARVIVAK